MAASTETEARTTGGTAREERDVSWGIPIVIGILLVIGGLLALSASIATTLVSVIFLGVLLIGIGGLEIISAFRMRRTEPRVVYLLAGLLAIVIGALFLWRPLSSLASLTLLIAGYFFASGLFRGITSVVDRYPRWGWDLAYGVVAVLLGIYVTAAWPLSSLFVLGTVIGVEIIARGIALIAASWVLRDISHSRMTGHVAHV